MSQADTWVFKTKRDVDNWIEEWSCGNIDFPDPCELTIAPYVTKRSTLQNRLYWEYMTQLGDYTGHTKDEMSLFFKWKFLGSDKTEVYGQSFNAVKSTTDLNVKEFCDYLRQIEQFAAEQGFVFKLPAYYTDTWGT